MRAWQNCHLSSPGPLSGLRNLQWTEKYLQKVLTIVRLSQWGTLMRQLQELKKELHFLLAVKPKVKEDIWKEL